MFTELVHPLEDLQQRIPVIGDKALIDLVNGIYVSHDLIRYQNRRSFLKTLADKIFGKDDKLNTLLHTNSLVGQEALLQWGLELSDSLRISQVALEATQTSLLETRHAVRRQHERLRADESAIAALTEQLEQLTQHVQHKLNTIESRIHNLESRIAAQEDFDRIITAWSAQQTYDRLPWVIQIMLLAREVFSSAVITAELQSPANTDYRQLLSNKVLANSKQMPQHFFGLGDLLDHTSQELMDCDRDLVTTLLEVRSIPQSRLSRMPYLFTVGTALELAALPSQARPIKSSQTAIELCRTQIDTIAYVTDTRDFVAHIVEETANDCLAIMMQSKNYENF